MATKKFDISKSSYPDNYRVYKSYVMINSVYFYKENFIDFFYSDIMFVEIEREPNNEYDPNAIKIIGYYDESGIEKSILIGYLPGDISEKIVDEGLSEKIAPQLRKMNIEDDVDDPHVELILQLLVRVD